MNKLEEYFEQDCGMMDKDRPLFDFYIQGYNRAKIEELEYKINELKSEKEQLKIYQRLANIEE